MRKAKARFRYRWQENEMMDVDQLERIECISRSDMSEVWRGKGEFGPVAVKVPRHGSQALAERFALELEIHASLDHPHILPALAAGPALVTAWVEGGQTLAGRIAAGPLPLEEALSIARQILGALNYCHQRGILHRDVKPANILLRGGHAYLIDFGVACYFHRSSATDASGTAAYMSPELIQNPASADQRSDVYAFGCVLYEMLTGQPPFPGAGGASDDAIKAMHLTAVPRHDIPGVPNSIRSAVLRALAKSPPDRFPGCGSFALALEPGGSAIPWGLIAWPALALLSLTAVLVEEFFL